jgi:glycosyltransferase involved in cell wall biosynthesis
MEHLDTSDRRSAGVGTWDLTNVVLALRAVVQLVLRLRGRKGIVYFPLSQNLQGFLRDSLFIHAAVLRRWKVAAHLRGGELDRFYARQPWFVRRWMEFTLARLDGLAVMSESLRPVASGLVRDKRIGVVANGTPTPSLRDTPRDPRTVLFLSNLRRRKGVVEAVEAARIVLAHEPNARFVFAGKWESSELSRTLHERANDTRISFVDGVEGDERDRLLAAAGILLFPPREPEGHPRVVLEGLAAGLPVVTTNRGAIAATVIDGESGFVLDDPNPEQLADRMLRLLRDEELRAQMGAAASTRHRERFTQEAADRALADWLDDVERRS